MYSIKAFTLISFFVFGIAFAFLVGRVYVSPQTISITPTPYVIPTVTIEITPTTTTTKAANNLINCKINEKCGGGTKQMTISQCNTSTCCILKDGTGKLLNSKDECNNYYNTGKTNVTTQTTTTGITQNTTANTQTVTYYPCTLCYHYSTGDSCQTYSALVKTKAECDSEQAKLDQNKVATVTPYTYQPTTTQKTAEDIQKCKNAVSEKYQNLIRGCYITYQGSAANMCASGYQSQSSTESKACE